MRQTLKFSNREQWLDARTKGIGASEVPTVLGINPWESPYELWMRKKHPELVAPKVETLPMRLGHLLEASVAQLFSEETGAHVIKASTDDFMFVDSEKPYIRVSPDRTFWAAGCTRNEDNKRILECKTTQKVVSPDDIPNHWFVQVQMNLGVSGMEMGALAWLTQGRDFGYIDVPFQKDLFDMLSEEVTKFWMDYIVGDAEPEATTVRDVLTKYATHTEGKVAAITEETYNVYREAKEVREQIAALKEKQETLENHLKVALQDAEALQYEGTTIATWKTAKNGLKFNDKKFLAEHADLCQPYMEETKGSRRFILK